MLTVIDIEKTDLMYTMKSTKHLSKLVMNQSGKLHLKKKLCQYPAQIKVVNISKYCCGVNINRKQYEISS